jgi:hypothetical protein
MIDLASLWESMVITGSDVPAGIRSLLEVTLATAASAKLVQKFAETK